MASEAKYHAKCLVALYNAAARVKTPGPNTECQTTEAHFARAFAELFVFIEETLADRDELSPVFKLSDLVRLYSDRLIQLGIPRPTVHATRLKDRILANFPELQAFKEGRDVLLIASKDVGIALRKACEVDMDDEAFTLARAARIVRKGMVNMTAQFNGTFPENCQVEAVPQFLVTLVAMLLYGANIKEQSLVTQTQALLSICQILMFNSSAHNPKQTDRNVTANLVSLLCLCIWVSFFTTRQGKENWLKNFSSWAYQFRMTEFSKYPQIKGPRFAIVMIS